SISLTAAGSGGPIIDFDAISDPAGGWAGGLCCSATGFAEGPGSDELTAGVCLSCLLAAAFSVTAGAVAVTGATTGTLDGFTTDVDGSIDAVVAGAAAAGTAGWTDAWDDSGD